FKFPRAKMSEDARAQSWASTHIRVQDFSYSWTISNFRSLLEEAGQSLSSSPFSIGDKDKWAMRAHLKGVDEESAEYLSVYLVLLSSPKSHIWAKFLFCILCAQGQKTGKLILVEENIKP
ncbi:speckle-type POZ protein, partial [Sigmodon hispidus]